MKRMLTMITCLALLMMAGSLLAAEYTLEALNTQLGAATDDAAAKEIIKDFMANAEDIDVVRQAQSMWEQMDPEGAEAYARQMVSAEPNSAKNLYLLGRVTDDPVQQVQIGRKVIDLKPEWPYGYRLLTATYSNSLFNGADADVVATLESELTNDGAHFEKLSELDAGEDYAQRFLFEYQAHTGDWNAAMATIEANEDKQNRWATPFNKAMCQVGLGQADVALTTVTTAVEGMTAQGLPEADVPKYVEHYYTQALIGARDYDGAIGYAKSKDGWETDGESWYNIACYQTLKGDEAAAWTALTKAGETGYDQYYWAETDTDLEPLRGTDQWQAFMTTVETNWDNGADERKAEFLATKINKPAPDWTLEDASGNTVALADLKGSVVILDFWATWCGPCRMAMPLIDEFTREHGGDQVKVFSVNVWEQGRDKPKEFMAEHDYQMTLLYGTNELAQAYGVQGIPYLCVIDTQGNIRFEENQGFHQGLKENLIWGTQDLL